MSEQNTLLETFGMDGREIENAVNCAYSLIQNKDIIRGVNEFFSACPAAAERQCEAILESHKWLSEAGTALLTLRLKEHPESWDSWNGVLEELLVQPASYLDIADWWLFFTALDSATRFQLKRCAAHKKEPRLTGHLLEMLASCGEEWSTAIASVVARTGANLAISEIDLEVGGGEQVNGGDFGLILDFDGRTVQPSVATVSDCRRIVPIIFQAKSYARPMADVSQTHPTRGPQRTLLASNSCASTYIFYENLIKTGLPLPPLVKPIDKVPAPTNTNVLEDSLHLATFLLRAATNEAFAPRAQSPEQALRAIFSKADPKDLSTLVVVSNDPEANITYKSCLSQLRHDMENGEDDDQGFHRIK